VKRKTDRTLLFFSNYFSLQVSFEVRSLVCLTNILHYQRS